MAAEKAARGGEEAQLRFCRGGGATNEKVKKGGEKYLSPIEKICRFFSGFEAAQKNRYFLLFLVFPHSATKYFWVSSTFSIARKSEELARYFYCHILP